ncbi:MAG: hypothetical protein AAB456_03985 [Patescibacteria group bacterium]
MDKNRRLFKKIFIAIVYLAVFSSFGAGIYFLVRPAPVPPLPGSAIYPIETIWSQSFIAAPDLYSVAARIKNPNTNFGASKFNYTFYLYDDKGALLATLPGESFIWPGESKYIILGGISLTEAPAKTLFKLGKPEWSEVKNFSGVDLTLGNINYGKGKVGSGKFFSIDFTASNNTPYNLGKIYVSAIVLNKDEFPIAAASTVLENLESKERRPSSIPWFSPFPGMPNRIDLNISTNLWERPELIGK